MSNTTDTKYLRPHRGKRSAMIHKGIVLKDGEIFFEIPEEGLGAGLGRIKMGDGVTTYADLPYFTDRSGGIAGDVQTVNYNTPDANGNVTVTSIPYAENIISGNNVEVTDTFLFRTSGGTKDIETGEASLNIIKGHCEVNNGVITVATPTSFRAIGKNQFDKSTMIISGYTITSNGEIQAASGSYVCYVHAVGGLDAGYVAYDPNGTITRIGWNAAIPTVSTTGIVVVVDGDNVTAITNDSTSSRITNVKDGYICISCTNIDDLCVHPRWSGAHDTDTAAYTTSTITIPTVDINNNPLPLATYGIPSVNSVADELNLAMLSYTQRIGHYPYTAENLEIVEELGVDYIYDEVQIFYVLVTPIVYKLASTATTKYNVDDIGTEEFLGTQVGLNASILYGQNLIDKLRNDVLTISPQTLSAAEKAQVCENIGAASVSSLGTAAYKDVPTSGDATITQVVLGSDSRLTDARPASDVYEWAKASTKPTYDYTEITGTPGVATTSANGLMSKQDKARFNRISGIAYTNSSTANNKFFIIRFYHTTNTMWSFTANLYRGARSTKMIIQGYNSKVNTTSTWSASYCKAVIIGDTAGSTASVSVVFGADYTSDGTTTTYTSNWITIAGGTYSGMTISDVVMGSKVASDVSSAITISSISAVPTTDATSIVTIDAVLQAPPTHNQAASTITAGTLAGKVLANSTAVSTLTTSQVRNIYCGTTDMTAGTTALTTGDIYLCYEA